MVQAVTSRRHIVASVDDVPERGAIVVDCDGKEIAVFRADGKFYALLNQCPHRGAPLCRGDVVRVVSAQRPGHFRLDRERFVVTCPWHGWEFDLETGQSQCEPELVRARSFELSIEEGEAVAQSPPTILPTAEAFPVSVESRYVVVHVPARGQHR